MHQNKPKEKIRGKNIKVKLANKENLPKIYKKKPSNTPVLDREMFLCISKTLTECDFK